MTSVASHLSAHRAVQVGDLAPDFALIDQHGQSVHLGDYLGKSDIILFFYPKDYTGGCTMEVCAFRDHFTEFQSAGAIVLGVSSDTVESHEGFAEKNNLPYSILSDPNGQIRALYGTPKTFGILQGRVTYMIDKRGIVLHIFDNLVNGPKHVAEALKILKTTQE
jgi:peroxiredoxin Q/BCP